MVLRIITSLSFTGALFNSKTYDWDLYGDEKNDKDNENNEDQMEGYDEKMSMKT